MDLRMIEKQMILITCGVLFEVALALADNDTEDNRQKFSEAYDKVHDQLCIRWNITMGLYWIRPYTFINLDSRNRWFIADVQNMPGEFVVAARRSLRKCRLLQIILK